SQKHFDLLKEVGKESFLLQAGGNIFAVFDIGVTGDQNHRDLRMPKMDFLGQFRPVHSVHAIVGDHEIDVFVIELVQRVQGIIGAQGAVALALEYFAT